MVDVRRYSLSLLVAAWAAAAHAHDFWIEPATFRPTAGQMIMIGLRVGQKFAGDPIPRSTSMIDSFVLRDATGDHAIFGFENRDPAGVVRVAGPSVIGYASKPSPLEISAEKFQEFLRQEGFDSIRADNKPHREHFSRFAKAYLGNADAKPFGWRFEIVPETFTRFRVLLDGKPYRNALVTALDRDGRSVATRTDNDGRASFTLPHDGVWLIKSVALLQHADQWETLWASVTFQR